MKIKDLRGLTLIELLISISILSIIGLTFFSTINTSININKKNEEDIKAMHLAQSEMENLRAQMKSEESDTEIKDLYDNTIYLGKANGYELEDYEVDINISIIEEELEIKKFFYEINVIVINKKNEKKTEIITRFYTCVKLNERNKNENNIIME